MFNSKKRFLITLIIVGVSVALPLLVIFYNYVKAAHDEAELIERVHIITVYLETYVRDKGSFPESLPALLSTEGISTNLLWLYSGASLNYIPPQTNTPDTTEVIVVTFRGSKIVVSKDFHRTVAP